MAKTKTSTQEQQSPAQNNLYRVEVIAKLFGVTVRRIQQLTQEGIIETTSVKEDGRTVRRYELISTIQRYVKYLSDKAYGKDHSEREMELREQKLEAEIALKESQGELHRIRTDLAAGKYIAVEKVKEDYVNFFGVFKKFAMGLPSRVAGQVSGYVEPDVAREINKDIYNEIVRLLGSFVISGIPVSDEGAVQDGGKKKKPVS